MKKRFNLVYMYCLKFFLRRKDKIMFDIPIKMDTSKKNPIIFAILLKTKFRKIDKNKTPDIK